MTQRMRNAVLLDGEMAAAQLDRLADFALDGMLPAVLDTSCVRTGLHYQLSTGSPPASVTTARDGMIRLFMEYDTLTETMSKLPKFAKSLGVTVAELTRMLNSDWLPYIYVVKLPDVLRSADPRAQAVRDADADDYPAAALAALLSPCILLTRNYTDFTALGVLTESQGVDAIMAVLAVDTGQMRVQLTIMVPAMPFRAAAAGVRWASDRFGPVTWLSLAAAAAGGIWWYRKQPPGRREQIRQTAAGIGLHFLDQYTAAADHVMQLRLELHGSLVPKPPQRGTASAILRELAVAPQSLSAQQLADRLSYAGRLPVAALRAYLRSNDTLFTQVRRGGFELGRHYELPGVA